MARRIRVTSNATDYSTRDLVKLFTRVFNEYRKHFVVPSGAQVGVKYRGRGQRYNVRGWRGTAGHIVLFLPRKQPGNLSNSVADDFWMGLNLCRGFRQWTQNSHPPDCSDLTIAFKVPQPKPKPSQLDKIVKLHQSRKQWQTKWKRANTALEKLDKQLRRLQGKEVSTGRRNSRVLMLREIQDLREELEVTKSSLLLETVNRRKAEAKLKGK